jgi:hypothetical protein
VPSKSTRLSLKDAKELKEIAEFLRGLRRQYKNFGELGELHLQTCIIYALELEALSKHTFKSKRDGNGSREVVSYPEHTPEGWK